MYVMLTDVCNVEYAQHFVMFPYVDDVFRICNMKFKGNIRLRDVPLNILLYTYSVNLIAETQNCL